MSLLIFAGIATQVPSQGGQILSSSGGFVFAGVVVAVLILIIGVIFVEQGQRRIPVQYAKRMVGRRQYGETSTYLPLKVNQAGVIPVILPRRSSRCDPDHPDHSPATPARTTTGGTAT